MNVVDLMRLQPDSEHPHGMPDAEFDALFTRDRPVIFAYHGYPWLIHRLTYRRANHDKLHVRGYKEEGTTTTPFDMVMLNDMDRFHLVMDVIDRVPGLGPRAAHAAPGDGGRAAAPPRVHAGDRRRHARGERLGLAGLAPPARRRGLAHRARDLQVLAALHHQHPHARSGAGDLSVARPAATFAPRPPARRGTPGPRTPPPARGARALPRRR